MKKVNDLALSYLKGLKEAYVEAGGEKVWENIESVAEGASESDIQALKKAYPEVPDSFNDSQEMNWLHFSDCANNGGTSQLFIDFSPSEKGVKGQIVRFLHDPDELMVIADSFDDYLKIIMDNGYPFINEDCIEDCE